MNPQTEPETPLFQSPKSLKSFDDGQLVINLNLKWRYEVARDNAAYCETKICPSGTGGFKHDSIIQLSNDYPGNLAI